MDTKDNAEKTAPSLAPAKPAPPPEPAGEPEPEEPVPSMPLSGLGDDSLEVLGAAFSGLSIRGPEGKEKEKEKEAVDMGIEEEHLGDGHRPSDETAFDYKPLGSAPSTSDHPAVPSPTTTTLPATHRVTSSPTTTPPMAKGLGFTGMPYSAYGVTPAATVPPMATTVSEPVTSSSTYTGVPESMPRRYDDDYHRPAAAVYMTGIPGHAAPEPGYTMPASGFTSLSGLRGPESCGGRSRGSGRSINKSLTGSEIREALRGATADLVGRSNLRNSGQVGAPDSTPSVTYHHGSFTSSSTSQSFGGGTDEHPGKLEEPTYADPCCDTKEPFRTKNGPAALLPRGELHASRAGPVGVDSPKGYGCC